MEYCSIMSQQPMEARHSGEQKMAVSVVGFSSIQPRVYACAQPLTIFPTCVMLGCWGMWPARSATSWWTLVRAAVDSADRDRTKYWKGMECWLTGL